jgi:peptide subunit release factor RF-3
VEKSAIVRDQRDLPVALFSTEWSLRWVTEQNPSLRFYESPAILLQQP